MIRLAYDELLININKGFSVRYEPVQASVDSGPQ